MVNLQVGTVDDSEIPAALLPWHENMTGPVLCTEYSENTGSPVFQGTEDSSDIPVSDLVDG